MKYLSIINKNKVGLLVLGHFILWGVIAQFFDIHADMADHWMAGRIFSLGYYEHPPMISWYFGLLNLFSSHLPQNYLIVFLKLSALFLHGLIFLQAYRLSKLILKGDGWSYLLILATCLYFSIGLLFINIDHPFLVFWLLASIRLVRYLESQKPTHLYMVGFYLGLAALSKYTAILFYCSLFIFALTSRERLKLLINPHLWLAGIISLITFSPALYWNYTHDFISFKFQLQRGLSGATFGENLIPFTLGHFLLFSPLFAFLAWKKLYQYFRPALFMQAGTLAEKTPAAQDIQAFLVTCTLTTTLFFSFSALRGSIADPKWLNIAYIYLFLLFLKLAPKTNYNQTVLFQQRSWIKVAFDAKGQVSQAFTLRFWLVAYALNIFIVVFIYLQANYALFNLPEPSQQKVEEVRGWAATAGALGELLPAEKFPPYVVTREYQLGGWLSLYNPHHPFSHSLEKTERNLWSPDGLLKARGFVMVCPPKDCSNNLSKIDDQLGLGNEDMEAVGEVTYSFPSGRQRHLLVYLYSPPQVYVLHSSKTLGHEGF